MRAKNAAKRKKITAALAKQFQAEKLHAKKISDRFRASKENPNSHKSVLKSLSPFDKQFLDESEPQTCPSCGNTFRRRLHFVWHSTSCGRKEEAAGKVPTRKGRSGLQESDQNRSPDDRTDADKKSQTEVVTVDTRPDDGSTGQSLPPSKVIMPPEVALVKLESPLQVIQNPVATNSTNFNASKITKIVVKSVPKDPLAVGNVVPSPPKTVCYF